MSRPSPARRLPPISSTIVGDGVPTTSVLIGAPRAFWIPVGVGSTTTGTVSNRRPPPARNPVRPSSQVSGRTSVTTTAPEIAVRIGRRRVRLVGGGARGDGRRGHGPRLGAGDPVSWPRASSARWTLSISVPYVAKSPFRSAAWASSKCAFA